VTLRPLIAPEEATRRLEIIFPRAAFDTVLSNPLAGTAVAAMIYVNAVAAEDGNLVADATWARPSTALWFSDAPLRHATAAERISWREAALVGRGKLRTLQANWGEPFEPYYGDNSRETLRDETLNKWLELGAVYHRPGMPTSSSQPRWALLPAFADLFDPTVAGDALNTAVEAWRDSYMNPGARLRAILAGNQLQQAHEVSVALPDGSTRSLEPGLASIILKGVIEQWAPRRLERPVVLTISEPGDKIHTGDAQILRRLGLRIDVSRVLPDALIADVGVDPVAFWIIEAVATDGPIDEARRVKLLRWANEQNIATANCNFMTAFASRGGGPAKRRLKDLAAGTFAWYADEPEHELAWSQIT